ACMAQEVILERKEEIELGSPEVCSGEMLRVEEQDDGRGIKSSLHGARVAARSRVEENGAGGNEGGGKKALGYTQADTIFQDRRASWGRYGGRKHLDLNDFMAVSLEEIADDSKG
ncbi:hypothetical protein SLS54_005573, partial [Diplodia seriata]